MKMQLDLHNPKVFKEFFQNNYGKYVFFAKGLIGDKEVAQDIVADSFIKLWAQKNQYSNMKHLQVYFYTAIKNACIDFRRTDKFRTKVEDQLKQNEALSENVIERKYQEAELVHLIYKQINQLPERMQQVFKLTYLEGYSRSEIAQMLKLSENTIRNTNAAAMKTLRISLNTIN